MICILIPGIVFSVVDKIYLKQQSQKHNLETEETDGNTIESDQKVEDNIPVLQRDGSVKMMDMDTYLTGVVLGEMPVEFDEEALKAQAVVARTYALKRHTTGQKHEKGAVCTQSSCCQAYKSAEMFFAEGGTREEYEKIRSAVVFTSRQALYYDGNLIEATYFSCSGGRTEDAFAVWGAEIPYLKAVDSPGEENATYYVDSVKFSCRQFAELLGINLADLVPGCIGSVSYTDGGGVSRIQIAGRDFEGVDLRKRLGLRSTSFEMTIMDDTIYIETRGFGHRVGMSQYGAEAMAVNGSNYQEILAHYYPGTVLGSYSTD